MSILALNISSLSIPLKIEKSQTWINMGTNNSNVPGNGPALAVLSAAIADLIAQHAAYEEAVQTCKQRFALRAAALETLDAAAMSLGIFTESVTGGDAAKILSAGFDIKAPPVPPQPVSQILNVRVTFNGEPGKSVLRWKRDRHADAYVIQCTQDPTGEEAWAYLATSTKNKFTGNGAIPGKPCWYRIAAVNGLGQGPWSEPALRPVF